MGFDDYILIHYVCIMNFAYSQTFIMHVNYNLKSQKYEMQKAKSERKKKRLPKTLFNVNGSSPCGVPRHIRIETTHLSGSLNKICDRKGV